MLSSLILSLILTVPNPDTRSRAWRVIDQYDPTYECALACTSPGDADRDTTCIQEAITKGIMDERYNSTELPSGDCLINSTLLVENTSGYELYGHGIGYGGNGRTTLYWDSATTTAPLLFLGDVAYSYFHDFQIEPSANKTLDIGIEMNNCSACFLPEQGSSSGIAPTKNVFERINMMTPSGLQTLTDGIVIDGTDANNEFHTFRDININGYHGDCIRIEGGQSKSNLFDNTTCLSAASGLEVSNGVNSSGCFTWINGGGGSNTGYDFYIPTIGCPNSIIAGNFESSKKFIYLGANNGNWGGTTVMGTRWASNGVSLAAAGTDRDFIEVGYSGGLTLINNTLGEISVKPLAFRFLGGGNSKANVMIGNYVASSLSATNMFPVYYPAFAESNVLWASDGQASTESLTLPIRQIEATATPDVSPGWSTNGLFNFNNGSTAVTNFLHGFEGQVITLWANGSSGRKVTNNANIVLSNGTDLVLSGQDTLTLRYESSKWREVSRSNTRIGDEIDVTWFGAFPDDATDDSVALQAAFDAACIGCTVRLPEGVFTVGTALTITKSIRIIGDGSPKTATTAPFGDTQWNTDHEIGTIFESTLTSGAVLTVDPPNTSSDPSQITIENLGIKGPGTGTTVGFQFGDTGAPRLSLKNVAAYNLYTGFSLNNTQDGEVTALSANGDTIGLSLGTNSNSNVFTAIDLHGNTTQVLVGGCSQNLFNGGTIQGHSAYGIRSLGGSENTYKNIYFESSNVAAKAISLEYTVGKGVWEVTADNTNERLTFGSAPGYSLNDAVKMRSVGGSVPTPLVAGTTYYIKAIPTSTTVTLSATAGGAQIDLTTNGSGRLLLEGLLPGSYNKIDSCHFGDVGDGVDVWTHSNQIETLPSTQTLTFKTGSSYNLARGTSNSYTFSDLGTGNQKELLNAAGRTFYQTPAATAESGGYFYQNGPFTGWGLQDASNTLLYELRDDVGYARILDAANNYSFFDMHFNVTPASRYVYTPMLYRFGTAVQTDVVQEETGSAGVTVQKAKFTGTAASNSTLAISGITADDSASVFLSLDGLGSTITAQATTLALGSTNVTTSGTVDGVDISARDADLSTVEGKVYMLRGSTQELDGTGGNTAETAFNTGSITWPANAITTNDDIEIDAFFDVTGYSGAANFVPRLYWGGKSSGVSLCYPQGAAGHLADGVRLHAIVHYDTTGASPSWWAWCSWTSVNNSTFENHQKTIGQTTQATNATILIETSNQFAATPTGSDKVKQILLRARRLRSN